MTKQESTDKIEFFARYQDPKLKELRDEIVIVIRENEELQSKLDKIEEIVTDANLYEFDLDYDYEENCVENYYPSDVPTDILRIIRGEKDKDGR